MDIEIYQHLQSILSQFTHINQFIDDEFIRQQCESGLKNYLLTRLANKNSSRDTSRHLPTLEKRLANLDTVAGYEKLKPLLCGASDWDEYQEALAQIDVTLWFKQRNLLKEIEPNLDCRVGSADILLSFNEQAIYCEVTSFQSISKSIRSEARSRDEEADGRQREIERIARNLLRKTKRQLPPNHAGILALVTTKSAIFADDVRLIADRLLPQRLQVVSIALWSWEGDGEAPNWGMIPTVFLINGRSGFQGIAEELSQCLSVRSEIVGN